MLIFRDICPDSICKGDICPSKRQFHHNEVSFKVILAVDSFNLGFTDFMLKIVNDHCPINTYSNVFFI